MGTITDEELKTLEAAKTGLEWDEACDKVKSAHGGHYPSDWWPKVKLTGLMDRVMSRFGESSELRVETFNTPEEIAAFFKKRGA